MAGGVTRLNSSVTVCGGPVGEGDSSLGNVTSSTLVG